MQIANARVVRPIAIPLLLCTAGCDLLLPLSVPAPLDSPLPNCSVAETIAEEGFATIRIVCETEQEEGEMAHELIPFALSERGAVLLEDSFWETRPDQPDRGIRRAMLVKDGVFQILGEGIPAAINRKGAVVGQRTVFRPAFETYDAVRWMADDTTDLPPLVSGGWSEAVSINDTGSVVGWATEYRAIIGYPPFNRESEPVLWQRTDNGWNVTRLLGFPEIRGSRVLRINSSEQIIVHESDDDYSTHQSAFVWESGELTELGSFGGDVTEAADINNAGQIVGWSETGELGEFPTNFAGSSLTAIRRAFLWEDGVMTELGTLGGESSRAVAINNRGDVIGYAGTGPFLYRDGTMRDLNDLAPPSFKNFIVRVIDINDSGDILATANINDDFINTLIIVVTPPD